MSEAIVSSVASTAFQPELAERQRYVVADDEEARLVNLLFVEPIAHGVAREVHKRSRLEEKHFAAFE